MIATNTMGDAPPSAAEIQQILTDTARSVKVMKASWLRVAMNLKQIRDHELWRHVDPPCENYEDYVFGILDLNRYVHRRMMQAMDYTEERRPQLLQDFAQRGEEVAVPSYDTVNQLRRAEKDFSDREDDFQALETRVWDDGVGRQKLKKEIDSLLDDGSTGSDDGDTAETGVKADASDAPDSLEGVVARLKEIEKVLLRVDVPKEARKLLFQLVEILEKECR